MSHNVVIGDSDMITIKSRNGNYDIPFIKLKEVIIESIKEDLKEEPKEEVMEEIQIKDTSSFLNKAISLFKK